MEQIYRKKFTENACEHERDMELLYGIADISNAHLDFDEQEIRNQVIYKWSCDERAYDY